MSELSMHGVSFGFGSSSPFLKDINLSLRTAEVVVILGGNGSGKTTLLRLLAGLIPPPRGDVLIDSEAVVGTSGRVGIVLQNPDHQMIAPTVEEEIALGCELRGMERSRMKTIVESVLARFDLETLRSRPPEALSGGQKQRVALAAVMAAKPEFLLLDEPDSFLDAPSRREFMRGLDEVRAECGILWAMPRPRSGLSADRCYLLEAGTLSLRKCDSPPPRRELIAV